VKVCIVRHGSAVVGSLDDMNRGLTEQGRQQAQQAGEWLATQQWDKPSMLVSPYLRARQTADQIRLSLPLHEAVNELLTPSADIQTLIDAMTTAENDLILVSHLPLVGRLAAALTEGHIFDQPWSPAECWVLEGDVAASGCMQVSSVWYPALVV